jgi:hypothetical protein
MSYNLIISENVELSVDDPKAVDGVVISANGDHIYLKHNEARELTKKLIEVLVPLYD